MRPFFGALFQVKEKRRGSTRAFSKKEPVPK